MRQILWRAAFCKGRNSQFITFWMAASKYRGNVSPPAALAQPLRSARLAWCGSIRSPLKALHRKTNLAVCSKLERDTRRLWLKIH